jgi:predicted ArsR family transcriptional regulator
MKFILNGTAEIMMQPARFKILQTLREHGPAFVDQIAQETGVHPRMVSHHLDVLEEQKLVESKYELTKIQGSKRGVAVRTCKITEKAEDALKDIRESSK